MEKLEKAKKSSSASKRRHTKPCSFYQTGTCRFSEEECDFLHVVSDIPTAPLHFRGKSCRYHRAGFCRNGDACRFKHTSGVHEDTSKEDSPFDSDISDMPPPPSSPETHTTIDGSGEWSTRMHRHHQYPLSPASFSSGVAISPVSPNGIYPSSAVPFSGPAAPNSKDSTRHNMYIQPPSWSPSSSSPYANTNEYTYDPNLAFPSIPLSSPLAVPGPVSPFHYPEEGLIYYYPYPHLHQPHSLYTHAYPYPLSNSNSNTLASPAGSFDSATTSSETSVSAIGSSPTFPSPDQWLTPPSTGNSISSNGSVEADDDTDNVYRPHFERPGQVKSSGARPKIVIPVTTTTVTDNINGLVAPASSPTSAMAMAIEAASSPTSPMASVATTGTSSTTPSGSSSTPKCLSPETDPKPKSMSKLRKDLNREAKYKTKPCKFWKARGACPRGDECTFMHGEDDQGWPHKTSTSANSGSNDSQSQSSPVSSTSSDGGNVKHQLPSKPLSELEEKRQRGFFPINWRVIGGGVLMGKPGKQQEQSKEEKACQMDLNKDLDNSVHANDLTLSSITFPTSKVEENRDSVDSESGSELEVPFDSVWDRIQAPRSATFDSRREEEKNNDILEGDIDGRGSQRARATSIPSTPRAALFLDSAKLFAAAESPGNL